MGNLAGIDAAVVDSKGVQLLKAGIDLLVHRGILRGDLPELLQQTFAALIVVPLSILQALSELGIGLVDLGRSVLGVDRAGALHGGRRGRAGNSTSLAAGSLLLLGWGAGWRGLWGAESLGGLVIMHTSHVVIKVPSTGKSISWGRSFTSLPQAEVRVVSMAMQSVGFALMAEQARIR